MRSNRFRAVERKYHAKEKPLNESSVCRFAKLYKDDVSKVRNDARDVSKKSLNTLPQGRLLFLGNWFKKIRWFKNFYLPLEEKVD